MPAVTLEATLPLPLPIGNAHTVPMNNEPDV